MTMRQVFRELIGEFTQTGEGQYLMATANFVLRKRVPTEQHVPKIFPTVQVEPHEDVLQHGHVLEQRRMLKGAHQTACHNVMRFETCKRLADKSNGAGSGWQKTAQEVETGRLPGTIRTNEPDNLTLLNGKIDTINSGEPTKVLRQVLCL